MSEVGRLWVSIGARTEELDRALQNTQQKLSGFGDSAMKVGGQFTKYATAPIVAGFALVSKAAMDLEATEAKYKTVFDGMTDVSDQFIKDFQKLTPATTAEARSMASGIQDLLVPMGFMRDEATDLTSEFMHVTGALANFNSGTHTAQDVSSAMQSAILGQYQSLAALGIQLNATTVEQKALEMGLMEAGDEMTNQIRTQVILAEVYNQSGDALEAYTEENLDAQTKMGLMKAEIVDVAAAFGQSLLPIITDVVDGIRGLVERFDGLSDTQKNTIMIIAAIVAAIGPLLIFVGLIAKGLAVVVGVLGAISAPVLIVIGVIIALIAIFKHLWDTNEEFREFVISAWETIKEAAQTIWGAITDIIETVMETIAAIKEKYGEQIAAFQAAIWDQIKNTVETVINIIAGIIKFVLALIQGDWKGAWEALKSVGETIWNYIKRTAENIFKMLQSALSVIWDLIRTAAVNAWENMKQRVIQKAQELYTSARQRLEELWNYIKGIPSQAVQWGRDIIQGLIDGIKNMAGSAIEAITGVVSGIIDAAKNLLKSDSPSKLFRDIGSDIGAGLAMGMESARGMVADASVSMTGMSGIGVSGGSTKNVSINMAGLFSGANVNIGSEQDAKSLARELYKLTATSARVQGVTI